jgi:hypothetical protein
LKERRKTDGRIYDEKSVGDFGESKSEGNLTCGKEASKEQKLIAGISDGF